ncbi:MAG: hypothetical protein R3181_06520 [Rubricoccaceae bacterium]|nr:hypothetical protein [Rubricoccaceae bacterium]
MTGVTLVLTVVAGCLAAWAGIVSLIGFAGWRPLARRYPADRWPDGEGVRLGWQSGRIGLAGYNGVLDAAVTAEGLYLRPIRPFAYNHPPVFIPWSAVTDVSDGMFSRVTLRLEGERGLRLGGRLGRAAKAAWAEASVHPGRTGGALGDGLEGDEPNRDSTARWRRRVRGR